MKKKLLVYLIIVLLAISSYRFYHLHTGYAMIPKLKVLQDEYYEIMHDLYCIAESVKQDVWSETKDNKVKRVQLRDNDFLQAIGLSGGTG